MACGSLGSSLAGEDGRFPLQTRAALLCVV